MQFTFNSFCNLKPDLVENTIRKPAPGNIQDNIPDENKPYLHPRTMFYLINHYLLTTHAMIRRTR